jgi:phosphatidylserine/phosphatidylglycerophosphate/cardiolipin synthase-like enzyme
VARELARFCRGARSTLDIAIYNVDLDTELGETFVRVLVERVRDGVAVDGAVWTGSTNFTTTAWSRQENDVLIVRSAAIAARYAGNFERVYRSREIARCAKRR